MKKAIIVVGKHFAGKSLTIGAHLTALLKIKRRARKFTLRGKRGFLRSQSFEESGLDVIATIKKYFGYDLLVFAARPETEEGTKFKLIHNTLLKASFDVKKVEIKNQKEAPEKAAEIFKILKS
jgi:hypothetical protein